MHEPLQNFKMSHNSQLVRVRFRLWLRVSRVDLRESSARRKRTLALSMLNCYLLAFVVLGQASATASVRASASARRQQRRCQAPSGSRLAPRATARSGPTPMGKMQQRRLGSCCPARSRGSSCLVRSTSRSLVANSLRCTLSAG